MTKKTLEQWIIEINGDVLKYMYFLSRDMTSTNMYAKKKLEWRFATLTTWVFPTDLQAPNPEITSKACHCLNEVLHDFKFTPSREKYLSFMFKFDTQSSTCEGEGDNCETLLTMWRHPGLMKLLQSTVSTYVQGSMVILQLGSQGWW